MRSEIIAQLRHHFYVAVKAQTVIFFVPRARRYRKAQRGIYAFDIASVRQVAYRSSIVSKRPASQKTGTLLLPVTSPNVDRFSKLFH